MPRPTGPLDVTRRLRAYEMFAAGMRKSEIARELGVTKASVGHWSKKDKWEEKINNTIAQAEEAVNHVLGNEIAHALSKLRSRLTARLASLEFLCQSNHESTRLKAIEMWFRLAGIKQVIVNPIEPAKGNRNIELIQDLIHEPIPSEDDIIPPLVVEGVSE